MRCKGRLQEGAGCASQESTRACDVFGSRWQDGNSGDSKVEALIHIYIHTYIYTYTCNSIHIHSYVYMYLSMCMYTYVAILTLELHSRSILSSSLTAELTSRGLRHRSGIHPGGLPKRASTNF